MGSNLSSSHSHQSPTKVAEADDGLISIRSPSRARKSKRLVEKFRSRQSSKTDLISQQQTVHGNDPIDAICDAQTPQQEGEIHDRDLLTTADFAGEFVNNKTPLTVGTKNFSSLFSKLLLDQIFITLTQLQTKPVYNDDRHGATHTINNDQKSTKHNADKAVVSCNSTATSERSRKASSSPDNLRFEEDYRVNIETESWRIAKNWKSDSESCECELNKSDRGKVSRCSPSLLK
jgi:hypothetical protein